MLLPIILLAQVGAQNPLSEAQILEKFASVPTFVVGNPSGSPISIERSSKKMIPVFFDPTDGNLFLGSIRRQKGMDATRLFGLPLADLLKTPAAPFVWIGPEGQSKAVLEALKPSDPALTELTGVPLLYVSDTKGGYVTLVQGAESSIPFFFDLGEAQAFMTRTARERPALGKLILKGTYLDRMLRLMRTAPSSQTRDIRLIPSAKAVEEFRKLRAAG